MIEDILEQLLELKKRDIELKNLLIKKIDELKYELKYNDPRTPEYLFKEVCKVAQKKTIAYIYTNLQEAIAFVDHFKFLEYALKNAKHSGDIFEFGVFAGHTINFLAKIAQDRTLYGFDSFEGLPEDWKGYAYFDFNRDGNLPSVEENVKLVKGWFDESLPEFLKKYDGEIAFLHIDCDLYSSTKVVLENLKPFIKKDLVIVFDEYFNYPNFEFHEFRAFHEFVEENNIEYKYLAYCGERVCVKIL